MIDGSRSTQPPTSSDSAPLPGWSATGTPSAQSFLDAEESRETALEQAALEFIRKHAHVTEDPAEVLSIAWRVYAYLDEKHGGLLDEVYHSTWFNESRRLESVKAHTALGGRLVHGCQSVPNMSGGACVPYGASIARFRDDLGQFREQWVSAIYACRADH